MNKMRIVWLFLFVMFTFSAIAVSSAAAEETQWLFEGGKITAELAVDSEGVLLLEDTKAPVKIDFLCKNLLRGVVGALLGTFTPALGEINDIEDSEGHLNTGLDCEAASACQGILVTVKAVHLPWKTELLLETHGGVSEFIDMFTSDDGVAGDEPGYTVDCIIIGVLTEDTCTADTSVLLANETGGVLATFDENEEINPASLCSLSGEESGLVIGTILSAHASGGTLSISEE